MKIITTITWMMSVLLILNCSANHASQNWQIESPDGRIKLSVKLDESVKTENPSLSSFPLCFSVVCNGKTV
ncbi:MAG: hypothetical protein EHM72_17950, partial [Calditrichaeota bacterium]